MHISMTASSMKSSLDGSSKDEPFYIMPGKDGKMPYCVDYQWVNKLIFSVAIDSCMLLSSA